MPTLLDLMGQPIPGALEGASLQASAGGGRDGAVRDDVFIEWSGHNNGFGDVMGQVVLPDGAARHAPRRGGMTRGDPGPRAHGDHAGRVEAQLPSAGRARALQSAGRPGETTNLAGRPSCAR